MADPVPFKSSISLAKVVHAVLATALLYSIIGGVEATISPPRNLLLGIERASILLGAGLAPLVVILFCLFVYRGKLTPGESRACLIGTGITSLVLLPLLGLVL